jgi:diketogulonate reductase-like aldo/keto reductase
VSNAPNLVILKHYLESELYPLRYIAAASIPSLGLGVYQLEGEECKDLVLQALKMGYRLIDTAQVSTPSISSELERFVGRY